MNNPWKILNIDPTSDVILIKRAYTSLAHNISPEDDPDRYRELHDAYKEALFLAKNINADDSQNLELNQEQDSETNPAEDNSIFDFSEIEQDYLPENNLAETIIEDIISFRESNNLDTKDGVKRLPLRMKDRLSMTLFYMYLKLAEVTDDLTIWKSFFDEPLIQYCLGFAEFRETILQHFDPDSPHKVKIAELIEDYNRNNDTLRPYVETSLEESAKIYNRKKKKVIILLVIAGLLLTIMLVCCIIPYEATVITIFGIALPVIGSFIFLFAAIMAACDNTR